jgi:hypothetical protein
VDEIGKSGKHSPRFTNGSRVFSRVRRQASEMCKAVRYPGWANATAKMVDPHDLCRAHCDSMRAYADLCNLRIQINGFSPSAPWDAEDGLKTKLIDTFGGCCDNAGEFVAFREAIRRGKDEETSVLLGVGDASATIVEQCLARAVFAKPKAGPAGSLERPRPC